MGLRRGRHADILIDGQVNGDHRRKLISHSARNGFLYTMEGGNGQTVMAKPYIDNINWTKGIDQKTGKPVDYDPSKGDIQLYSGAADARSGRDQTKKMCPSPSGRQQLLAVGLQSEYQTDIHPGAHRVLQCHARYLYEHQVCGRTHPDAGWLVLKLFERYNTEFSAIDPITGDVKKQGARSLSELTAARLRPAAAWSSPASPTGPSSAYDDTTMEPLWKINVGTGFNAPPMTFEVNGKQYVAILSGLSPISKRRHWLHAGAAGAAQPDHAVRVRAVTKTGREWREGGAAEPGRAPAFIDAMLAHVAPSRSRLGSSNKIIRGGRPMSKSIRKFLLASVAAIVASPGLAADVTPERLINRIGATKLADEPSHL